RAGLGPPRVVLQPGQPGRGRRARGHPARGPRRAARAGPRPDAAAPARRPPPARAARSRRCRGARPRVRRASAPGRLSTPARGPSGYARRMVAESEDHEGDAERTSAALLEALRGAEAIEFESSDGVARLAGGLA